MMRLRPAATDAALSIPPAELSPSSVPCFSDVHVAGSLDEAAEAWAGLEAIAPMSPYQTRAWMAAWMQTEGRAARLEPMIVVATDAAGQAAAVLPLGIGRRGPLTYATFLGGRETNYNLGLYDPDLPWSPAEAMRLLRDAARAAGRRIDVFVLVNQPLHWGCFPNPLAATPGSQPSPSSNHRTQLQPDADAFLRQHQSSTARKKLRAKAAHLAALGPVAHVIARSDSEIARAVSAYLAQRVAKHAAAGLPAPDIDGLRALLSTAARPPGALELHALTCGDTIVATFGGLAHAGRFSGLMISYETEPRFARCSPGELLLTSVLRTKCEQGFDSFDLGIGEARYKENYCPIVEPLVDCFVPLTALGRAWAFADGLRLQAKAAVKRSPRAWAAARLARKLVSRLHLPL